MDAIYSHFKTEFQDKVWDESDWESWNGGNLPQVSKSIQESNEKEITLNELTVMVFKGMIAGKSPGDDGLSVAFYRAFWGRLGVPLLECLKASIELGELTDSQKRSVIRLIRKKGKNADEINGWRPISLMNVDAKIFSKCLAARLKTMLSDIIDPHQMAYTGKVHIGESHIIIDRLLEKVRAGDLTGLLCAVDFKSAFSTVRHQFLWDTLDKMNVSQTVIKYLKVLYNGANSCVLNFGTTTRRFTLERGARQGDPVAPYLFIIAMEVLLRRLRTSIVGLCVLDQESTEKDLTFADDLTLMTSCSADLDRALSIIDSFRTISGLEINWGKTELMELGKLYQGGYKIKTVSHLKITGRIFQLDYDSMLKANWDSVLSKVRAMLAVQKQRKLSLIGKGVIINSQILPVILFPAASLQMPEEVEKTLNKELFRFLWNGPEKITRSNAIKSLQEGGVNMPHLRSKVDALHCRWITNLKDSQDRPWKQLFSVFYTNGEPDLVTPKSPASGFAGHCIGKWNNVLSLLPPHDTLKVYEFLSPATISTIGPSRARTLTLQDIQAPDSILNLNFLQHAHIKKVATTIEEKVQSSWTKSSYGYRKYLAKGITSLPWPKPTNTTDFSSTPWLKKYITFVSDWCQDKTPLWFKKQKQIYTLLIRQIIPTQSAFKCKFGEIDWDKVNRTNIGISNYSRMRAFMVKSSHGTLYGNKDFKRFGFKVFEHCNMCDSCDRQDSSHVLAGCRRSTLLYANLEQVLKCQAFSLTEKILGSDPSITRPHHHLKRFNLLRKYIYDCNHKDNLPKWEEYLHSVDRAYVYEYAIAAGKDRVEQHLKAWNK